MDVDILANHGYSSYGIDCGNRTSFWTRRQQKNRLVMANGKHLPFESETIDVAFCDCVFPHLGVVGDSYKIGSTHFNDRLELVREMTRVVRPGGHIVVSSPNRFFPFDLFHGRDTGSYRPRPYWPGDKFLLSVGDYRQLFRMARCRKATALPVEGYWGFIQARLTWKGMLFGMPVRFVFWLVSRSFGKPLGGSPLCPWIVVQIEKL